MRLGYARVSTRDQNLELQMEALKRAGCEQTFTDKASGGRTHRPGLEAALAQLRTGDVLVVWKLDRLGRNLKSLIELVERLNGEGVDFVSVTDTIDTTTPAGRFFFHVMASLAQMERELIIERTKAGLEAARRLGRLGGRPRKMTPRKIDTARKLFAAETPPRDIADTLGVSVPTLYRWLPAASRDEAASTNPRGGGSSQSPNSH